MVLSKSAQTLSITYLAYTCPSHLEKSFYIMSVFIEVIPLDLLSHTSHVYMYR